MEVRLNKYLADRKLASRREADVLIAEGKVLVNGKKAVIGQKIGEDDIVRLSPSATRAKTISPTTKALALSPTLQRKVKWI